MKSWFRHTKNLKMTIWIFCEWCSWQKNSQKWSYNGHLWDINLLFFSYKIAKKLEAKRSVFYFVAFDLMHINFKNLGISKWLSDPQLCEIYLCSWQKKLPEEVLKCITPWVVWFISDQSLCFAFRGSIFALSTYL